MWHDWETSWKDKNEFESHFESTYSELSAGERKGLKKHIKRFVDVAEDFMSQIGNGTFRTASKDYQEETVRSLQKLWIKACSVYFRDSDSSALFTRSQKNNNPASTQEIPMGPWAFRHGDVGKMLI